MDLYADLFDRRRAGGVGMSLLSHLLDALVTLLASVFSSMGLGGGSLILMYLTEVRGMEQSQAQAIGLLLFIASAVAAIPFYLRAGLLGDGKLILKFLPGGILFALLGASIASALGQGLLRKIFGFFLIFVGVKGIFAKLKRKDTAS